MNSAQGLSTVLRARIVLLTGQAFSLGLTLALLYVPTSAIFLSTYGSERLPYTYIAIALFGFISASALTALQRRWSLSQLAIATTGILAALFFAAWLALNLADANWVSFVLMVVFELFLQIGFVFIGGQAGRLFDVRQIKRLFPRVVSGFAMGFLVGGFIAVPLINWLGRAENLLLTTVMSALILLIFQVLTNHRFRTELSHDASGNGQQPLPPLRKLLTKRFVALIFFYQMLSGIGAQLLDFMVFDQAARRFTGSEALARFFGNYTWIINLTELLFLALLAGYLLNRFGLRLGLAANPGVVGTLAVAGLAIGFFIGPEVLPFFILVLAARISNIVLTDGTTRASLNATYLALPPVERLAVQTSVEGIGMPLALGLAGVILLIFTASPGLTVFHLLALILLVVGVWLVLGNLVFRDYAANLLHILKRRVLGEAELTIADSSTLAVVERLVNSDSLREVRLGLDMLTEARHPSLDGHLMSMAAGQPKEIQVEALKRIERLKLAEALPVLMNTVEKTREPGVMQAALQALAAIQGESAVPELAPYLNDPHAQVRIGAMVGLLRYAGDLGKKTVESRLTEMERAADPAPRRLLALILEKAEMPELQQTLITLLKDEDVTVRGAALLAARRVPHPSLTAVIVPSLENTATRSAAMSALISAGAGLLPFVEQALAERDRKKVRWLLQVCRQVKGQEVVDLLRRHIRFPDRTIRTEVLVTLAACDFQAEEGEMGIIFEAIQQEVQYALYMLAAQADLDDGGALAGLQRALADEQQVAYQRLFHLLSFLYDSRAMRRAASLLRSQGRQAQALAMEVLDVTLLSDVKGWILPLIEPDNRPEKRIQALAPRISIARFTWQDRLRDILENGNQLGFPDWIHACAFYAASQFGMVENADFAEGGLMLLTIERVAILNQVEIFADTPDHILAAVAQILEEVELEPGHTFIEEGLLEDCMYIVVDGKVRVHHDGQTIILLETGDTVGELAVLDPQPRSASVTTEDNVLLFRLAKEAFDEVMSDRPEIAQGVIRALTRRLRAEGYQLAGEME
ncbi:MAG: cyclic nucleotide-binding domain-containing protein [Anaerolineales bacterium]